MGTQVAVEQRKDARTDLTWPVSIWMPDANRFFNAQSVNISKSGALLTVPMTTPIRPGNVIEVNFPRTATLAKQHGQFARIKTALVVRVNRHNALHNANISVAVQFTGQPQ